MLYKSCVEYFQIFSLHGCIFIYIYVYLFFIIWGQKLSSKGKFFIIIYNFPHKLIYFPKSAKKTIYHSAQTSKLYGKQFLFDKKKYTPGLPPPPLIILRLQHPPQACHKINHALGHLISPFHPILISKPSLIYLTYTLDNTK